MKIKKGDFIVGKEIWIVTKVSRKGLTKVYDIESVTNGPELVEVYNWYSGMYEEYEAGGALYSVPLNFLRHLGKIVPKEKAGFAIRVLFGKTER